MKPLLVLTLFFFSLTAFCQPSRTVDSITVARLSSLNTTQRAHLSPLYKFQVDSGMYKRLDTLHYRYAIIRSYAAVTKKDTTIDVMEWYFNSPDSLPVATFWRGKPYIAYQENFTSLQLQYNTAQPVQEMHYKHFIVDRYGCIRMSRFFVHRLTKRSRRHGYHLTTEIDRTKGTTNVSVSVPPKHPWFIIVRRTGGMLRY